VERVIRNASTSFGLLRKLDDLCFPSITYLFETFGGRFPGVFS
jgi:hypothetical protein